MPTPSVALSLRLLCRHKLAVLAIAMLLPVTPTQMAPTQMAPAQTNPAQTAPTQTAPTSDPGQHSVEQALVDLNSASMVELKALPGMGAAYARRVIENRPYTSKNQLVTRGVLPQTVYEGIRDRIIAHRGQSSR